MFNSLSRITVIILTLSQLLTGCGPSTVSQLTRDTNAKQLTAGEILLLAKGNTLFIQGHTTTTKSYLYFDPSGHVFAKDIATNKDTGRWDVSEEGELCYKMKSWWFAKLRCFPVYTTDENKYYLFNNSQVLEFTADYFQGDNQNLYYETKKSKKKFLMAQSTEEKAPSPPEKNVSETTNPLSDLSSAGPTEEELKSTVKWMAKDCPDCNLADTNLSGADLIGAKLQGADLSGANLSKANLRRADLRDANLEKADFTNANMPGADLRGSNLTNAVLKGTNLIRANLTGATIEGTNFDGALLEGVEGLQQ